MSYAIAIKEANSKTPTTLGTECTTAKANISPCVWVYALSVALTLHSLGLFMFVFVILDLLLLLLHLHSFQKNMQGDLRKPRISQEAHLQFWSFVFSEEVESKTQPRSATIISFHNK